MNMKKIDVKQLDVTKLNVAVDRLLAVTDNPRHRFMLTAYARHRALEVAGRYREIVAPDMMSPDAVYHLKALGNDVTLVGPDRIAGLYRLWAQTHQSIFYIEEEEIMVSDHYITSVTTGYQQVLGKTLRENKLLNALPKFIGRKLIDRALSQTKHEANLDDMYMYRTVGVQMIWPYDERGRVLGEDIYEPLIDQAELFKIDAKDVMTSEQAAKALNPLIPALPSFDKMVLGKSLARAA
jgi:hypothetical protein